MVEREQTKEEPRALVVLKQWLIRLPDMSLDERKLFVEVMTRLTQPIYYIRQEGTRNE